MQILKEYSNKYQLEIYGKNYQDYKTILLNETNKLKLNNVIFKDETDDIPYILNNSHILIASSIKEAFHIVVVEAMSMGLPVIASDIPAHKELLEGVDPCVIVKQKTPKAIADAVNNIVTHPETYQKISEQVLERSKHFSISTTLKNYYNLYQVR